VGGSGNSTHNLRHAMLSVQCGDLSTPACARGFDAEVTHAVEQHDGAFLVRRQWGRSALHGTSERDLRTVRGVARAADRNVPVGATHLRKLG
jgi:hypothetical protein